MQRKPPSPPKTPVATKRSLAAGLLTVDGTHATHSAAAGGIAH